MSNLGVTILSKNEKYTIMTATHYNGRFYLTENAYGSVLFLIVSGLTNLTTG